MITSGDRTGGAIHGSQASGFYVSNSLFFNNEANEGGAIYLKDYATAFLDRVTIVDNIASEGAGIYNYWGANAVVTNSIISGNEGNSQITIHETFDENNGTHVQSADISYTNFQGYDTGVIDIDGGLTWGTGNIDEDPLFVDAENGDYSLMANSPCINAGDPETTDSDGTLSDMGAYPYLTDHSGPDWYVSTDGSDITGDGSSLNNFFSIQAALNFANANDNVHVSEGTYYENIIWPYLTSGISLLGAGVGNSIIDGGGQGTVITIETWTGGGLSLIHI